jgi:HK97 family phage major capsid protein
MSSRHQLYSSKNSIQCAPLRSFKSREAAFRFGAWFAASLGNEKAARFCEDAGIKVDRAMSEGVSTAGGVLVPGEMLTTLYSVLELRGVIRATADVVPVSRDALNLTKVLTGMTTYFVGEGTAVTASQPVLTTLGLVVKKLATYTVVSSELEEDALIDIGDVLMTVAANALALTEDSCAFNGDGTPTYAGISGITTLLLDGTHNAGKITAAAGHDLFSEIDATDLANLIGRLPAYALADAGWFVSQMGYALAMCRLAASVGGITIQNTPTGRRLPHFMGFPVYLTQVLPNVATTLNGAVMLAFGDMRKAVTLADRRQPTLARADQVQTFDTDQVQFRVTERMDINVHNLGDNTTAGAIVGLVGG